MTIVRASGVEIELMGPPGLAELNSDARYGEVFSAVSQLHFTSSTVTLRPLVGGRGSSFMFGRSFMVIWVASGEISHDSATSPVMASAPTASLTPKPCLTSML